MSNSPDSHRLLTVGLLLSALLCGMSGCAMPAAWRVYPEPNRKSINEIYFEALEASRQTPEQTLGLNPSVGVPPKSTTDSTPTRSPPIPTPPEPARDHSETPPPLHFETPPPPEPQAQVQEISVPLQPVPAVPDTIPLVSKSSEVWRKRSSGRVRTVTHRSSSREPNTVSETFEETDIRQALQVLATQAGVTLIVDEQIMGTITCLIEEESFESALRKVLLPLGLVYRRTEFGEYIVAIPDPTSPLFSRVSDHVQFQPMHVGPDELLKLIPEREARFITVVDKRNLMMIEAPPEIANAILERLQQCDKPIPQVELEAIVCVIAPDRGFKSGLDWNHAVTLNGSEVLRLGMSGLAFSGHGSQTGTENAFSNFAMTAAFVKLLAQEGYLTIRAAPRVTARDGELAKIAITRQSYFSTQPASTNAFFNYQIEQVEAGITLEITPIIRGDNITVKIEKAEVSEDIRTTDVNAAVANNPYPLINRRSVSTTVSVKDTETIVIGGLVQRQTVDRITRVPWLGSIPYCGRMFQTVEQLEQDAEVVIFISPRIVSSGPSYAPGPGTICPEPASDVGMPAPTDTESPSSAGMPTTSVPQT